MASVVRHARFQRATRSQSLCVQRFGYGAVDPAYVRGQAYLQLHQGIEAVAESQKMVDHRNMLAYSPRAALVRAQMARAYALQGDTAKADAAYRDFFALWKDADPDVPIMKLAKAAYPRLHN